MLYGAATSAVVAALLGQGSALPAAPPWWLSLLDLALAGAALAVVGNVLMLRRA
jgi:hypothetical protein